MSTDLFSNYPANYSSRDEVIWSKRIGEIDELFGEGTYLLAGLAESGEYIIKLKSGRWTRGSQTR